MIIIRDGYSTINFLSDPSAMNTIKEKLEKSLLFSWMDVGGREVG